MAIIKLRVSLQGREDGEKRIILPGYYNTEDPDFPSMLVGESRPNVVELPADFSWEEETAEETEEPVAEGGEAKPVRRKKSK